MTGPGGPGGYAEHRVALRWPLLLAGLYAPVASLALLIAAIAVGPQGFFWVAMALFGAAVVVWAVAGQWLPYVWPAAVRIDPDGVSMGGLGWAGRHPGRTRSRTAIVPRQWSQVFECPWAGVLSIGVTTDRAVLAGLRREARRGLGPTPLGNLSVPFMRAALVVRIDLDRARPPEIRPARGALWRSYTGDGFAQPVWVVPTRYPGRLSAALDLLPQAAAVRVSGSGGG